MHLRFQDRFLTFSVALGVAATLMAQGGGYTTIDFPQATQTLAWGINKSGHIAGQYTLAGVTHGFKLIDGRFITIDYPGSTYTDVRGINDRGDVTGQYRLADNVNHGFLMVGERFTSVDFPNATSTLGWGVGPSGEVVGQYTLAGVGRAFKLSGNEFVTIDIPGATGGGAATGINALGEVSGITTISGATHAFLWRGGEVTLFDVPGSTYTNSTKVTLRGEVIGRYEVNGVGSGYFLRGGVFTTQRFPGAIFTGTADMNERGGIVGRYQNPDQTFHGFLLSGQPPACVSFVPRVAAATGGMAVTHANDFRLVNAANPAAPGEVLSLFASGLGPTQPGVEPGSAFPANPLGVVSSAVEVRIDGKLAEVFGAVGLPGSVDGYQVNFRVPADARQGAAVLQLSSGMAVDTLRIMIQ